VELVVQKLQEQATSTKKPGILLGRVQSGKTRAYLGVIARAFDRGYNVAIILTKGTKSLAAQTLSRAKEDFSEFIAADQVEIFDILNVPDLTPYELTHKLIFIVKKEDDNMRRLLKLFEERFPVLRNRNVLIIDDEADMASVSGRKVNGINALGIISKQIDTLRELVKDSSFLQVTATPYALYLQPEDDMAMPDQSLFKPKRPAFTILLPSHAKYVGGDEYFEKSADSESPAFFFFTEVPLQERDALKKEDRRRLQIGNILTEKNTAVLRHAVIAFLVGGTIRRLQQKEDNRRQQKYSFLFHTESSRISHEWQERVMMALRDSLVDQAQADTPLYNELLFKAYADLKRSIQLEDLSLPSLEEVKAAVTDVLLTGQLMITKVNSDKDIHNLLDDSGQLKLRTPFNLFIGGQILDRGITINNLIAFYYGRNPNRFQQDTVLQHSRMYGARSKADLAVTRFYAPLHVHQVMRRIHEFDGALRGAFESGAHDRGVYFLQRDATRRLIACSPNKLLFSDVVSIRPGRRLVLSGFQTVAKSVGIRDLRTLDSKIKNLGDSETKLLLISVDEAVSLLELAYKNIEFNEDTSNDDRQAHTVALEHLSRTSGNTELRGKVWLLTATDRDVQRYREEGRFSNAPDTKQQKDMARAYSNDIPVLMLLRQRGTEERGWRGLEFWWPVILIPQTAPTVIFATDEALAPDSVKIDGRPLSTEEIN